MKTTTRIERRLGDPAICRLHVHGLTLDLPKAEVLALAEQLARVLASYAHEEREERERGAHQP